MKNPGKAVTRYSFFSEAWMRTMTFRNVTAGFRVTGVYPLDRTKLPPLHGNDVAPSLSEATGLAYIPMLSPAPRHASGIGIPAFSAEELQLFSRRSESVDDIDKERYEQ